MLRAASPGYATDARCLSFPSSLPPPACPSFFTLLRAHFSAISDMPEFRIALHAAQTLLPMPLLRAAGAL